jgi:serine/threonine protein kinase
MTFEVNQEIHGCLFYFLIYSNCYLDVVEKKIGEGNFGEVYCVKNIKTQNKKAMKTMEKKDEGKSIEAELQVGLRIASDCRYLIPVEEFFKESNNYCLIMELCKNDLETLLSEVKTLPEIVLFLIFKYLIYFNL